MRTYGTQLDYRCVMRDAASVPDFADLLSEARKNKGWSQERLEAESGVSRSSISRYERRLTDVPEPDHVRALCAALDIDPRRAAVSLRYLTADEIEPVQPLDPKLQAVVDTLRDPRLSDTDRDKWIDYLTYLASKAGSPADRGR
jgi:transcriptional regulator with XRE-family HTH domain